MPTYNSANGKSGRLEYSTVCENYEDKHRKRHDPAPKLSMGVIQNQSPNQNLSPCLSEANFWSQAWNLVQV